MLDEELTQAIDRLLQEIGLKRLAMYHLSGHRGEGRLLVGTEAGILDVSFRATTRLGDFRISGRMVRWADLDARLTLDGPERGGGAWRLSLDGLRDGDEPVVIPTDPADTPAEWEDFLRLVVQRSVAE